MSDIEVKETLTAEDLVNALNKKVEASKKEKEEELALLAYSYVKVISTAIAECPTKQVGSEYGHDIDTNKISLKGISGNIINATGYVEENQVGVRIEFDANGGYLLMNYDIDAINRNLDKYNISISVVKNGNYCKIITVTFDPQKKKKLENEDVNALDEVNRTVENKQPVGFVPPTDSYDNIKPSSEIQTIDETTKRVTTPNPIGFVPPTSAYEELSKSVKTLETPSYDDISRVVNTPNPEGFAINNEVDYNSYGRSR